MSQAFYHETLHRTDAVMQRLQSISVTVCGAGALGANITESLARQGFAKLTVIDRDRIEERNLSTQPYYKSDIGAHKAKILSNSLFRAVGATVKARVEDVTTANVDKLLHDSDLVIDTFDNSGSRLAVAEACASSGIPCLHAGLARDYAEVIWNEVYRVPSAANDDICDYPLARNLVLLTASVACEVVVRFAATDEKRSHTITLGDFSIQAFG